MSTNFRDLSGNNRNGVTLSNRLSPERVAASQTNQVLGALGAAGDFLSHVIIKPATTSPGAVTISDGVGEVFSFAGGATSVGSLAPLTQPINMYSRGGAWKVTTGADVSVETFGNFT